MAKLVVLSKGMTGQSYELKVDRTTIGRVEDNTFPIPQPSVSSHHCEIYLRGNDVVVKDLNSTNGTFINNQQITGESVLKPGQILRLGQVEMKLDAPGAPASAPSAPAAPAAAPAPSAVKRPADSTMVISKGVSLEQLEQGPQGGFDTTTGFSKKVNTTNKYFIIGGIAFIVIIAILLFMVYNSIGPSDAHH